MKKFIFIFLTCIFLMSFKSFAYNKKQFNYSKPFQAKITYYTSKKSYSRAYIGVAPFDGAVAVPKEIPLYTIFLIDNKLYIAVDRGGSVKMLNNKKAKMIIDIYVPNATNKQLLKMGTKIKTAKIIRYGGSRKTFFNDVKKIQRLNKLLAKKVKVDLKKQF